MLLPLVLKDRALFLCSQCTRRADLLASIKSKAFIQASVVCVSAVLSDIVSFLKRLFSLEQVKNLFISQPSKARRHLQVELKVSGDEAGSSHQPGFPTTHKLSLKARTKRDVHISGKCEDDLRPYSWRAQTSP